MRKFIKEFDPANAKQKDFNKLLGTANGTLTRHVNQLAAWKEAGEKSTEEIAAKNAAIKQSEIDVNRAGIANWQYSKSQMEIGNSAAISAAASGD